LLKNGVAVTVIGSLQTVCGRLVVEPGATTVSIFAGASFAPHPDEPTTWSTLCPSNKVVMGFTGGFGDAFDAVAFQCTELLVSKDASGDVAYPDQSTIQTLPTNGGDAGAAFAETCGAGRVAQGSAGRAMSIVTSTGPKMWVEAFGLSCAKTSFLPVDGGSQCCGLVDEPAMST